MSKYKILISWKLIPSKFFLYKFFLCFRAGETVVMQAIQSDNTSPLPRTFWITLCAINVFFFLYAIVHFSIFIDGYLYTCKQYRVTLEKLLGVHGTIIPVIHSRLSCISIFDFMDYVQPDTGNAYREGFINTGADLLIGVIASFFTWCLFLIASISNYHMVLKRR